jgi:alkylation response protein AidB-like acyl-CoA dehydrogenase
MDIACTPAATADMPSAEEAYRFAQSLPGAIAALPAAARAVERTGVFPPEALALLKQSGVLAAPLPLRHGGFGLGTEPQGRAPLMLLLRRLGAASLAVGRIFEGHVNALQLICRFASPALIARCAGDARDGHLFAIWNTEIPPGVRRAAGGRLTGCKAHGSAAGLATRAVVTVDQHAPQGSRMLLIRLAPGERVSPTAAPLHGMRGTASGTISLDGYQPDRADWLGGPGDYLTEPLFSAGAWRALAVLLGGLDALSAELRSQLMARNRASAPHQRRRIAEALLAQESAALWVAKAAAIAEAETETPDCITGYVALARQATEQAGLTMIQLAQRSLGLQALLESNPAETLMRDLVTYLRQPALDEALDQAATHFTSAALPDWPLR